MRHSGFCAWCSRPVKRINSRGNPFKYCSPECDKDAMAKRMRENWRERKKIYVEPKKPWFDKIKSWFKA